MALGSHLITVRRLEKYINDVIGKKANLPDTSKTIIGNISQINSDLTDKQNISSALKFEIVSFSAGNIGANGDLIMNVGGITNNGNDVAYIVDTSFDYVIGTARRASGTETRVTLHNFYSQPQNVNYGTVIRLYK